MAARDDERFERLLGEYVDRLNAGESIARDAILTEHPDLGPALLREIGTFEEFELPEGALVGAAAQPLGTLGDYTLRRQIGRGGMGVVYEAWQGSMDRRVALKVMPKAIAVDTKAVARFIQEAQLAGRLSHPNIVHVHGMGVEQQIPYYAMDFVEGETLAQILVKLKDLEPEAETPFGHKDGAGYFESLARAFADVADGLQHAHSKKVIHRDIKPSNLILDGEGRLRILDFGLARIEGQQSLTISGDVVGTPLYMSPEQARRKKIPVDHRTDIYSLGATLYEMLTLQPPFRGIDHEDTLSQIIELNPVEPSRRNPRVPRDIETIVLKCLRKEPRDRYGTTEALGQDLRRFVRGEVIEARAEAAWEKAVRIAWRWKARLLGVAMVLLLALTSGVVAFKLRGESLQREQVLHHKALMSAVLKLHLGWMSRQSPVTCDPGSILRTEYFSLLEPYLQWEGGEAGTVEGAVHELKKVADAFPRRPDACYYLARGLSFLGHDVEASQALDLALRRDPVFVAAKVFEAAVLEGNGDPADAERASRLVCATKDAQWAEAALAARRSIRARRWRDAAAALGAVEEIERAGEPYVGALAEVRLERAFCFIMAREPDPALEEIVRVEEAWPAALEPLLLKAQVYLLKERKDLAAAICEEVYRRAGSKDAPALWIAGACWASVDIKTAESWLDRVANPDARELARFTLHTWLPPFNRAVEEAESILKRYPESVRVRSIVAWSLCDVGRPGEAAAGCREALRVEPGLLWARFHLGHALLELGRFEEAMAQFEEEIQLQPGNPEVPTWSGYLLKVSGRLDPGIEMCRRAVRMDPGFANAHFYLGACLYHSSKFPEAEAEGRAAVRLAPRNAPAHNILGLALRAQGKTEEAKASFLRALEVNPNFTEPHASLGLVLRDEGKTEEALAEFQKDIDANPASRYTHYDMGRTLELAGRMDAAFKKYCDAIGAYARHAEAHQKVRGLLHERLDPVQREDALNVLNDSLEESLAQGIEDSWVQGTLALVLLHVEARRDPKRALYLSQRAASGATRWDPNVLAVLGQAQLANGLTTAAAETLEDAIAQDASGSRELWDQWLKVSFADLGRSAAQLLSKTSSACGEYAEDVRWLLERLASREPLRIDCGGDDMSVQGVAWSHDRFFDGGERFLQVSSMMPAEIVGTTEGSIYQTTRLFADPRQAAYRLPLPRGQYRVTLHFAEIRSPATGESRFEVTLEGRTFLDDYGPLHAGFATADKRSITVTVEDGILDIQFIPRVGQPQVSGIEVEPLE